MSPLCNIIRHIPFGPSLIPIQARDARYLIHAPLVASTRQAAVIIADGERHGIRKAGNIVRAQEAERYSYSRVLGFSPPDRIEPVEIFNLPDH